MDVATKDLLTFEAMLLEGVCCTTSLASDRAVIGQQVEKVFHGDARFITRTLVRYSSIVPMRGYTYMYIHLHTCTLTRMMYIHTYIYMYANNIYTCRCRTATTCQPACHEPHMCTHICVHISMHKCIFLYAYTYTYTHICISVYLYRHAS